jgi:hypothetical protein
MEVTTFLCEWDIGINDDIFIDEEVARVAVAHALVEMDVHETLEELEDQGLVVFETKEVRE